MTSFTQRNFFATKLSHNIELSLGEFFPFWSSSYFLLRFTTNLSIPWIKWLLLLYPILWMPRILLHLRSQRFHKTISCSESKFLGIIWTQGLDILMWLWQALSGLMGNRVTKTWITLWNLALWNTGRPFLKYRKTLKGSTWSTGYVRKKTWSSTFKENSRLIYLNTWKYH